MSTMQIVFSIIGLLLIGLIIGHGMWNIRRNERRAQELQQELERKRQRANDPAGFDEDGIGPVRVIKTAAAAQTKHVRREEAREQAVETPVEQEFHTNDDELDLPSFTVEPDEIKKPTAAPEPSTQTQRKLRSAAPRKAAEANEAPTQQSMDLPLDPDDEPAVTQAPDMVIALHVVGAFKGPQLLEQLTELGFKYGDFDIFHRHVDTAGNGPVLFSLANMFNPGTFDIDNMEHFETKGVALFLALPIKSNSTQAFNMMHNAADKLAAAIDGGQVLDEHRNPLTRQAVQHIHQNIREYERKRLIRQ